MWPKIKGVSLMKLRKMLLLVSLSTAIASMVGCASAPVSKVTATDETTAIILVGDLLGGTVSLSNGFVHTIGEDDLQRSPTNLPSVKDSAAQKREYVLLQVDPGEIRLEFSAADGKTFKRQLFVAPGVTHEVRL
jgi:hypothetical protein